MEEAGAAALEVIVDYLSPSSILVLAGKGNNGGDGFVVARLAHQRGLQVRVILCDNTAILEGDALRQFDALPQGLCSGKIASAEELRDALESEPDVIVDAMLGTGSRGAPRGNLRAVIEAVNLGGPGAPPLHRRWNVVALDIPSGLPSDDTRVSWTTIQADLTITFGAPKVGMILPGGSQRCGRIVCKPISFPPAMIELHAATARLLDEDAVGRMLPRRDTNSHKGVYGMAVLVGGSRGMGGAAILATRGALASGAGLVRAYVPSEVAPSLLAAAPAAMVHPTSHSDTSRLMLGSAPEILHLARRAGSLALGPGLGLHPSARMLVRRLVVAAPLPLVLDADALTHLASFLDGAQLASARRFPLVLTPHPGEAARLLRLGDPAEAERDRFHTAREIARLYGAYVLLKGPRTLIATPGGEGPLYINPTGNSGLARGGSGDILTGLVAGLLAQGLEPAAALSAGAFLHGLAADLELKSVGAAQGVLAEGVLRQLGPAYARVLSAPSRPV